jgi:hypothetical protein
MYLIIRYCIYEMEYLVHRIGALSRLGLARALQGDMAKARPAIGISSPAVPPKLELRYRQVEVLRKTTNYAVIGLVVLVLVVFIIPR